MSTKFSGGKILKKDFWEFHDKLRDAVIDNHPLLKNLEIKLLPIKSELFEKEEWQYSLQLFDAGEYYFLRFLSFGYFIENNLDKWNTEYDFPKSFQQIMIHTGSMDREEIDGLYGAGTLDYIEDYIDALIRNQSYLLAILVDKDTLRNEIWRLIRNSKETSNV